MRSRSRGSARFEPYYKVQWYDERSMVWRDVQRSHSSRADAESHFISGKRCRLMRISMDGREPLPDLSGDIPE